MLDALHLGFRKLYLFFVDYSIVVSPVCHGDDSLIPFCLEVDYIESLVVDPLNFLCLILRDLFLVGLYLRGYMVYG